MSGFLNDNPVLSSVLKVFYILYFDHGGGDLSTFVGKAIASALTNMFMSIAGAMSGLAGKKHGGANQESLNFLIALPSTDEAEIEKYIEDWVKSKKVLYGFGHPILKIEDPRATILYNIASNLFEQEGLIRKALIVRKKATNILKKYTKTRNPYPNVDAISGALLYSAGFDKPDYYPLLFGWSRLVGIVAQIIDERVYMRNGKGVPLYRCRYLYDTNFL
jgi:citrate synthase